jgi:bis(5'-nucleosyl)-tetraphosphatase (symmetrical)
MEYLIGDVQGCDDALGRLLRKIDFSPSRDRLLVLGDLVNRGPASLATLRRLRALGSAATGLLGNHDLHLLAVAHGVRPAHRSDTLASILDSAQRDAWLDWGRSRPLAVRFSGWLCVHAGVPPQWDADRTLSLADELHALLRGSDLTQFLPTMYGNETRAVGGFYRSRQRSRAPAPHDSPGPCESGRD